VIDHSENFSLVQLKVLSWITSKPSGVQPLKNPNPLKDVEVSALLDVVVLV